MLCMKEFLTNLTKYKALEGKVRFIMGGAGGGDTTRHSFLICIMAVDTQFSKISSEILNLNRMRMQQVQNPPKKEHNQSKEQKKCKTFGRMWKSQYLL